MTDHDTVRLLRERAISVRLDERAQHALDELVALGMTQSEAIRQALTETASRRRSESLAEEARRLAADPEDRAEMAAIAAFMESLRPELPPDAER
jgi:Arc/MetJ-type ribon-helix-helix transcriptional regulator